MNTHASSPAEFSLKHPLLLMDSVSRSFARVVSYTFLIVIAGLMVSLFISDLPSLRWLGVLVALMAADYLLHARRAPYSVRQLFASHVPGDNLALCADTDVIQICGQAIEKTHHFGGNPYLAVMRILVDKTPLARSLERLDVSVKDFESRLEDAYEKSAKAAAPLTHKEALETIHALLERAALLARFHSRQTIDAETVFAAAGFMQDAAVSKILDQFSIQPQDIDNAIVFSHFVYSRRFKIPPATGGFALSMARVQSHRVNRTFTSRPTPTLDRFSRDLTDCARAGQTGFLIGHEEEYERMITELAKPGTDRNVMLVGEAGVGKESLVQHLAFNIVSDHVPGPLFDRRLVALSVGDLIAGASYDEMSARFEKVITEILRAGNIVLYIPEIHNLARTSQVRGGIELSDMLMPVLKNSSFPVIGTTFPREFKEYIETRSDFFGSFEVVRMSEIGPEEATTLLTYDAVIMERFYKVAVSFSAIKQSVTLAAKYLRAKPLPSSAQDLLREALAQATQRNLKRIDGDFITALVEQKVNVPIHKTSKEEAQKLLNLEDVIHHRYINQEPAVRAVAEALRSYRSGLAAKGGPIASFLFVGPTGVGKTELSKILADIQFGSEKFMVRFDMSEYQQKDSIVRFIGSPDGSIAGALTEAIIQQPYSLILLDEFEKAHPDILNLFLQVLDEGRLTDSLGRVVDFQNTIVIATSNAESVYIQEQIRAKKSVEELMQGIKTKLTSYFKPELLNRFSDIVIFRPLLLEHIIEIARLKLGALAKTVMEAQGVDVTFDESAVHKIAELGYDQAFGARPIARAIDDYIKAVLSKMILSQEAVRGETFRVEVRGGEFVFEEIEKQ